jgi:hypothetical protein
MLRAAIYYIMSQEQLYLNILDPQYARYIDLRHDLQEYLEEMYGNDIDFGISVSEPRGKTPFAFFYCFFALRKRYVSETNRQTKREDVRVNLTYFACKHQNDRWSFYGPVKLNKVSRAFLPTQSPTPVSFY